MDDKIYNNSIRRSSRKTHTDIMEQNKETLEESINTECDYKLNLKVVHTKDKGRGVICTTNFYKNQFVCEYDGKLISHERAIYLEKKYSMDNSKGSFMFFFKYLNKQLCVDSTEETKRYGRLINHSKKNPNCKIKVVVFKNIPRLIIQAKTDILAGTELLYDYGDRSPKSLKMNPWLNY